MREGGGAIGDRPLQDDRIASVEGHPPLTGSVELRAWAV